MGLFKTKHKKTYLKDYKKPDYILSDVKLEFDIFEDRTLVKSKLSFKDDVEGEKRPPLVLNGVDLELKSIIINGETLKETQDYLIKADTLILTLKNLPLGSEFSCEIDTIIYPKKNFSMEGLYQSGDILCTQNEAEGFRKITYFLDRPDVMTRFTTTIRADKKTYPYLLSNGNLLSQKNVPKGRHEVVWEDPFLKPCYLFALVAGDLAKISGEFTTKSKRKVTLEFYVDKGNEDKCDHAMDSLKRSMKWDEDVFGLEYDLDLYMIVAVDSFNMGAMENKGLNIFNSAYVLAKPETATDSDYQGIEGVIAHEYFHNWTGNRVTCRDWFQLTLKEGLTVFRDQEFSSDMNSRAVQRIQDVKILRDHQFVEDSGPMAHPIKPSSYVQIDNFYTSTIYNKGAEVIRMMHTLIGPKNFRKGTDLYFERHDGQAVRTEDFVAAMQDASGENLSQFSTWYSQAGTPNVSLESSYNQADKTYKLTFTQTCPTTPESKTKKPFIIPLSMSLYKKNGSQMNLKLSGESKGKKEKVLSLTKKRSSFIFENIPEKPIPSLLHQFSAPILLNYPYSDDDLIVLMTHDQDLFNRYEAAQILAKRHLLSSIDQLQKGKELVLSEAFLDGFGGLLHSDIDDEAFIAMAFNLPSLSTICESLKYYDVENAFLAREYMLKQLSFHLREPLFKVYERLSKDIKSDRFDSKTIGKRSLKNMVLSYLALSGDEFISLAYNQFNEAKNMTDEICALGILTTNQTAYAKKAVDSFYSRWKRESLVMDKWLSVQAMKKQGDVLSHVMSLEKDPIFDGKNPNKIRALYGSFSRNLLHFHDQSGVGYRFIGQKVREIDVFNPSIAARLALAFKKASVCDSSRKTIMVKELKTIRKRKGCSSHVFEVCDKILKGL